MVKLQNILVPHAGTPAGDKALELAIHIAKPDSAKIILSHTIEEIHHPITFALAESERQNLLKNINDANESIKKEMEKEMKKRKSQCEQHNLEAKIRISVGDPAEQILSLVKEEKIDLIVMAKRRKLKGVKKLLSLGSVSRKIVENVSCPVLLIDIEN